MARGQFVLEFIIFLTLAVLFGVAYLAFSSSMFVDVSERQRLEALNDIGYMIQDELILAESVEDGYERTFSIPARADRFTYEITNDATTLTLTSNGIIMNYDLPQTAGSLQKGKNTVRKRGALQVVPG